MSSQNKILVIGASGQIGVELTLALRQKHGAENVIASDISAEPILLKDTGPYEELNVLRAGDLSSFVVRHQVTEIYLLAAMLSATGEQDPRTAWQLNMDGLLNVLELAREYKIKIFWPSSIAAAAPTSTVYGISKYAGECWCQYYFEKYGVDVRSLRYPGLISYTTQPGGGTTDYAIDIFHAAIDKKPFRCFLSAGTVLPMLYMPDAIKATMQLMEAPPENIRNRMSYAIGGMSFTPAEIFGEIKKIYPEFEINYQPDHRQRIADSWPEKVSDTAARMDWGWKPKWNLERMVKDMLVNLETIKLNELADKFEKQGVL